MPVSGFRLYSGQKKQAAMEKAAARQLRQRLNMERTSQDISKTQMKKEAEERQLLGLELTKLTRQQLAHLDIPDDLRSAVIEAKSITSNIAARRQRQYIGALMREVDPELIRRALVQAESNSSIASEKNLQVRLWMDRLLTNDPDSIEAFISVCPGLERQRLRQLLRNIKKAEKSGKSSKAYRTLEQLILQSAKK